MNNPTPEAEALRKALAEYMYSPPFANPEFLAQHGERMERHARERAASRASEVIAIVMNHLPRRRETMSDAELEREARKLCTAQNIYWDKSQPTTHYMTEAAAIALAKKYRGM